MLLALVIFFHVGGGWALNRIEPAKPIAGEIAPMEVRMVSAEQTLEPQIESAEPPPPVDLSPPPPDLSAIVAPPPPDLPPPEFPIARIDIPLPPELPIPIVLPPEKKADPKLAPPKPAQRRQVAPEPSMPAESLPQQTAARVPDAPRTVSASQLGYLVAPSPAYPARSRRSGDQGTVMVRVLVDNAGRPSQVSVHTTSGHPALDEAALSAVRAARFRPYAEGGVAQAVWALVPINFVLH